MKIWILIISIGGSFYFSTIDHFGGMLVRTGIAFYTFAYGVQDLFNKNVVYPLERRAEANQRRQEMIDEVYQSKMEELERRRNLRAEADHRFQEMIDEYDERKRKELENEK